jgi:hypothetical protein
VYVTACGVYILARDLDEEARLRPIADALAREIERARCEREAGA